MLSGVIYIASRCRASSCDKGLLKLISTFFVNHIIYKLEICQFLNKNKTQPLFLCPHNWRFYVRLSAKTWPLAINFEWMVIGLSFCTKIFELMLLEFFGHLGASLFQKHLIWIRMQTCYSLMWFLCVKLWWMTHCLLDLPQQWKPPYLIKGQHQRNYGGHPSQIS